MSVSSGDWAAKSFLIVDEKALNRVVATGSVGGNLEDCFYVSEKLPKASLLL